MEKFPKGFLFGTSTAPYQIEGAWDEDGKGESNWDWRVHNTSFVKDGATGDTAIDHYHKWREDVGLMGELGLNAYRFGISWSRVQPKGQGAFNQKGLEFYEHLIDALLEKGIEPFVTLCHYEIPQALVERGGWLNRDTVERFADYAAAMAARYGDRVKYWATLNEPCCIRSGFVPAPETPEGFAAVAHHLLLAHGRGVQAIHATGRPLKAGLVTCLFPVHPLSETLRRKSGDAKPDECYSAEDDQAAVRLADTDLIRAFLDPIFLGRYPDEIANALPPRPIRPGDMETIGTRPDFMGINYYSRTVVAPLRRKDGSIGYRIVAPEERGIPQTTMGWEVYPEGIHEAIMRVHKDYGAPEILVTENGFAQDDKIEQDGHVHDPRRIDYLSAHLAQVAKAISDGAKVDGYFCWTHIDNFEWDMGWDQRFGLIYLDRQTLKRAIKDSGLWYRDFIKGEDWQH